MPKAKLEDKRIEEEWRIKVKDLFLAFHIPTGGMNHIHFEKDWDVEEGEQEDDDECVDMLVIKLTRDSEMDKKKKKKKAQHNKRRA